MKEAPTYTPSRFGAALDWAGPWAMLAVFWVHLNTWPLLLWLHGGAAGNAWALQSEILFGLVIIFSVRRWGQRAVPPSLVIIALHCATISFPIGGLGGAPGTDFLSLELSQSALIKVPLLFLALRYGLDPRGVAQNWLTFRRSTGDVFVIAVFCLFAVHILAASFTTGVYGTLDATLILILLTGLRPIWPWLMMLVFTGALASYLDLMSAYQVLEQATGGRLVKGLMFPTMIVTFPLTLIVVNLVAFRRPIHAGLISFLVIVAITLCARLVWFQINFSLLNPTVAGYSSPLLPGAQLILAIIAAIWRGPRWVFLAGVFGAVLLHYGFTVSVQGQPVSWGDLLQINGTGLSLRGSGRMFSVSFLFVTLFWYWVMALLIWALVDDLGQDMPNNATLGTILAQHARGLPPGEATKRGRLAVVLGDEGQRWAKPVLIGGSLILLAAMFVVLNQSPAPIVPDDLSQDIARQQQGLPDVPLDATVPQDPTR